MTTVGNTVIMTFDELTLWGERLVVTTIEKLEYVDPNAQLTKKMIMENLNIGLTTYQNKVVNGKYPLALYGTPKKRFAIKKEFEQWKKNYWGRY